MNVTKKLEAEIKQVMKTYWESYAKGDLETWVSFLPEDYRNIGTTNEEIWNSRNEIYNYTHRMLDQLVGNFELRNVKTEIIPYDPYFMVHELGDIFIKVGTDWNFYSGLRLSSLLKSEDGKWYILHQHGSYPDSKVEDGEAFAFDKIKRENTKLRDAVKRRTVELEQKNHDLEIEASLERVRTVAMSMNKPDDLLDVCQIISEQLEMLNVSDIRNVQVAIIDELKKTYSNYQFFTPYSKKVFEETAYENNPASLAMVTEMQKSINSFFIGSIKDDELLEFRKWRKKYKQVSDPVLDKSSAVYYYFYSIGKGGLGLTTYQEISHESLEIFKRFHKVFALAYSRFIDIQKAEARAYEARIETALEKVRAIAMAMHNPNDLSSIGKIIYNELKTLGFESIRNTEVVINNDDKESVVSYHYSNYAKEEIIDIGYKDNPIVKKWAEDLKKAEDAFVPVSIPKKELQSWDEYRLSLGYQSDPKMASAKGVHYYSYSTGLGALSVSTWRTLSDDQITVLGQFRNVFKLSYQRYKDIEQADAQAREAQIELALERVRARTMAMQKSHELKQVIQVVYEQFVSLNIHIEHTGFIIDYKTRNDMHIWLADKHKIPTEVSLPYFDCAHWNSFNEAKAKGISLFTNLLDFKEKNKFYQDLFEFIPDLPDKVKKYYLNCPGLAISTVLLDNVGLYIENFDGVPYSKEENNILMRFGKVFQQTYTRFQDLQKAEEQAQEAQIEAALERVRASMMAMHQSDELRKVIGEVFSQLQVLGFDAPGSALIIYDEKLSAEHWMTGYSHDIYPESYKIPYVEHSYFTDLVEGWQNGLTYKEYPFEGKPKTEYAEWLLNNSDFARLPEEFKKEMKSPARIIMCDAFNKYGMIEIMSPISLTQAEVNILNRFSHVFEQTYTRFLDLKKAEAQTREAQIEAALEKVRSRSLAMHTTNELGEVVVTLVEKLKDLDVVLDANGVVLCTYFDDSKDVLHWIASPDFSFAGSYLLPYFKHPIFDDAWESKESGTKYFSKAFSKDEKDSFFKYAFEHSDYKNFPEDFKQWVFQNDKHILSFAWQKNSAILIPSHTGVLPAKEDVEILKRFAKVFEQSYVRFLDLKKAEVQAREAKIESALEKVRSRTMAMQHSDELPEAANDLFKEVKALGINAWSCGYNIFSNDNKAVSCVMSSEDIIQSPFNLPLTGEKSFKEWLDAHEKGMDFFTQELEGKDIKEHYEYLLTLPDIDKAIEGLDKAGIPFPSYQINHLSFFTHGFLLFITYENVPDAHDIFRRFTKVFEQTYTRFLDLQKAEEQAREAQVDAALERARSHSMQMQHSEEIKDLSKIFHKQLTGLDIPSEFSYIWLPEEEKGEHMFWATWSENKKGKTITNSKSVIYPLDKSEPYTAACFDAWKSDIPVHVTKIQPEEVVQFFTTWKDLVKGAKNLKAKNFTEGIYYAESYMKYGCFGINIRRPLSEEEQNILLRFTIEFERAYTRFLDLKKAEKQAREAQIEASLEKVRGVALSLQKSDEMLQVAQVLFEQLLELGFTNIRNAIIDIKNGDTDTFTDYDYSHEMSGTITQMSYHDDPTLKGQFRQMAKTTDDFFELLLEGKELEDLKKMRLKNGEAPDPRLDDTDLLTYNLYSFGNGAIGISNFGVLSTEEKSVLNRFSNVFTFAYKRYTDMVQAENQAREVQIELSLERIRSKVTAMQESRELLDIVVTMRTEFVSLGHEAHYFWYMRYHPETYEKAMTSGDGTRIGMVMSLPRHIHGDIKLIDDWEKSDEPTVVFPMDVETAVEYVHKMITLGDFKQVDPNAPTLDDIRHIGGLTFIMARTAHGEIGYSLPGVVPDPPKEDLNILTRFAGVFDLAYRRFEDLKTAEQRNRETQIELALERVRSKTMAMHNSDDMANTVVTLFEEVLKLGLDNDIRCGIGILEGTERMETRSATLDSNGEVDLKIGMLDMTIHPLLKRIKNGWERGEKHYVDQMSGKDVVKYYTALNNEPDYPFLRDLNTLPKIEYHNSFSFSEGILFAFSPNPMSDEAAMVLDRFANVFGQTYRRFRDLQKAEEQARESQIEAALERVRSKAMAMHSSEDLGLTVDTFFAELKGLNVSPHRCGLGIIDKETKIVNVQAIDTNGGKNIKKVVGDLKLSGHPVLNKIYENWELQKEYFPVLHGKEIMEYYNVMNPQVKFHEFADDEVQYGYYFYFKEGGVYAWTDSELPERDLQIFRRYSSVLSLTYRRYLDLKEAEAQAREAKIEASLERIRSRALSMQKSTEVGAVNDLLFDEFEKMGIEMVGCGISVINEETDQCEQWRANQVAAVSSYEPFSYKDSARILSKYIPNSYPKFIKARKEGDPFLSWHLKGNERNAYLEAVATLFNYSKKQRKEILASYPKSFMANFIFYKRGWLSLSTLKQLSEYEINFSRRFVEAFDFAHTRFLDLQRAEAQAKEATKQASLDRVRGEIASMRSTEDLQRITPLIWSELEILEVPFNRCGVFIVNEPASLVRVYLTTPYGKPLGVLNLPVDSNELTRKTVKQWQKKAVYLEHWNKNDFISWMQSMIEMGQVKSEKEYQGNIAPPESLDLHFIPFTQGMLYVGNHEPLTKEKIDLVKALAKAFSVAYARYEDFKMLEDAKNKIEITLNDLKATQSQLVHAEKMASLGELTAGIAHEIQNPLNFVNNFSEVNKELIEELIEELEKGDLEEVKAIANDIAGNEEKIKHHGKRADGIVKGMLQHSRSNTGNKEPTDINELADEYLRLSYHGLRAKDKSFNADFRTELDESLPKIKVIPQDIGRVLLNLINNAFHACTEKSRSLEAKANTSKVNYKPAVIVNSKKLKDIVEIKVKDNGSGIPDNIKEKIFQPFFTTKATGEGTGLGLSLSYDIITKGHGGELLVDTNDGEGTIFTIRLPIL